MWYLISGFFRSISNLFVLALILAAVYFSFTCWQVAIPIFLFLVYLVAIFLCRPIKHKGWFHGLWWLLQLSVMVAIVWGATIAEYYSEYSKAADSSDMLMSEANHRLMRMMLDEEDSLTVVQDRVLDEENGKQLFGGMEVGMSPYEVRSLVREKQEALGNFRIDKVWFQMPERYYYRRGLYGVSMGFMDFYEGEPHAAADTVVAFLKQKYGEPHLFGKNEEHFNAVWRFEHKYIVVKTHQVLHTKAHPYYVLLIYQPELLKRKLGWAMKRATEEPEEVTPVVVREEPMPEWKRKELENEALKNSL